VAGAVIVEEKVTGEAFERRKSRVFEMRKTFLSLKLLWITVCTLLSCRMRWLEMRQMAEQRRLLPWHSVCSSALSCYSGCVCCDCGERRQR